MGLLIDSTVLIRSERLGQTADQLLTELLGRWGDVEAAISVVSAAELFHGCWRANDAARRARREEFVESIVATLPVRSVDLAIARVFGEVDARLTAEGSRLPTADLLIACTALAHDDEIVTGNRRHFDRVDGLTVHELV